MLLKSHWSFKWFLCCVLHCSGTAWTIFPCHQVLFLQYFLLLLLEIISLLCYGFFSSRVTQSRKWSVCTVLTCLPQVKNWYSHTANDTWLLSSLHENVFSSLSQEETGSINKYASEKNKHKWEEVHTWYVLHPRSNIKRQVVPFSSCIGTFLYNSSHNESGILLS